MGFHPATCLSNLQNDTQCRTLAARRHAHTDTHTHTLYICIIPRETQHKLESARTQTNAHAQQCVWQWVAQTLHWRRDTTDTCKLTYKKNLTQDACDLHTALCVEHWIFSALFWHLLRARSLLPSLPLSLPFFKCCQRSWGKSWKPGAKSPHR